MDTERGAVIGMAGALDYFLARFIKSRLVNDKDVAGPMFNETGPLGSYGTRVRSGYLMGLYPKLIYKDFTPHTPDEVPISGALALSSP